MTRWVWGISFMMIGRLATAADAPVSFQKDVLPVFAKSCFGCHNDKVKKGKYDMTTPEATRKGGKNGAAVVPSDPEGSLAYLMMAGKEEPAMPKDADPLDEKTVALVKRWIAEGASFGEAGPTTDLRTLLPKKAPPPTDYQMPTPTTALTFSPDGKELAVGAYYEITFWDPSTGRLLRRLPTSGERIHALGYSRDGRRLLHAGGTPGEQGEVIVWDVAAGKPFRELLTTSDVVFAAAFRPDDQQVAAGGTDRVFRIWDVASGKELHAIENHADWILALGFSPDGHRLVTAGRDKTAKVWDQPSKEALMTFPGHTAAIYAAAFNHDGTMVASAGEDKVIRLWKLDGEGKEARSIGGHGNTIHALRYTRDGKIIYSAAADKTIRAYDPSNGKQLRSFDGHKDWIYSLALSSDETRLASGSWDGDVRVWDAATGKLVTSFLAVPAKASASAAATSALPK